jgi:hypothetical protein
MNEDQEPMHAGMEPVVVEVPPVDEEVARKRAREFDDAVYATLTCRTQSDQARALVDEVMELVTEAEAAAGKRINKRGKKEADLRVALEGFLADLLRAQAPERTHGYVYRSMRPAAFTEGDIGYRVFKALAETMVSLGLVESFGGFQSWSSEGSAGGGLPSIRKATRFRASQRLLDLCESHAVRPADFHRHFLLPLPEHPLQLRTAAGKIALGKKMSGRIMRYPSTEATESVGRQLKKLNAFFDGFKLTGGVHRGYVRVFNNGDDPAFNWNMGGRLYSNGDDNYQQMSREKRLRMRIGLDRVCEIDIRASYLTMLHAWFGQQLDPKRDPYDIPGLGPEWRGLVKRWVTASFGNNAPITKWPRELRKSYFKDTGKTISKQDSAAKIGAKVLAAHPVLARLGETVGVRKCGWAELMHVESKAMFYTMLDLMANNVPSLSVHDSIIVPELNYHLALWALRKRYQEFTGANPVLVINPPLGHKMVLPSGTDPHYNIVSVSPEHRSVPSS